MKGDIELVEESKSCNGRSVRKKVWQLEQRYHCSLIGICLSRNDLQAFSQRKSYGISSKANDFEIHQHLTGIASLRSTQSRVLHKMLDHKYSQAVRRYSSCSDDEAIRAQWEEDQRAGRVAGAYWAIMTSGVCSSRLLDRVYGDSHMISFETFSSQLQRNRKVLWRICLLVITFGLFLLAMAINGMGQSVLESQYPNYMQRVFNINPALSATALSVTAVVEATSQQQLDAIYQELTDCEHVLMAL